MRAGAANKRLFQLKESHSSANCNGNGRSTIQRRFDTEVQSVRARRTPQRERGLPAFLSDRAVNY
jgi:hypothetical protein